MGGPDRHGDGEAAAVPFLAFHTDRAPVQRHEFLHQSEPYARPLEAATPGPLHSVEPVEKLRHLF